MPANPSGSIPASEPPPAATSPARSTAERGSEPLHLLALDTGRSPQPQRQAAERADEDEREQRDAGGPERLQRVADRAGDPERIGHRAVVAELQGGAPEPLAKGSSTATAAALSHAKPRQRRDWSRPSGNSSGIRIPLSRNQALKAKVSYQTSDRAKSSGCGPLSRIDVERPSDPGAREQQGDGQQQPADRIARPAGREQRAGGGEHRGRRVRLTARPSALAMRDVQRHASRQWTRPTARAASTRRPLPAHARFSSGRCCGRKPLLSIPDEDRPRPSGNRYGDRRWRRSR